MSTLPVDPNNVGRSVSTVPSAGAGYAVDERVPSCLTAAWEAIKTFFAWLFSCCCCCCHSDPEPVSNPPTRSRTYRNNHRGRHVPAPKPSPNPNQSPTENSPPNTLPPAVPPTLTQPKSQPGIQPQPIPPPIPTVDSSVNVLNPSPNSHSGNPHILSPETQNPSTVIKLTGGSDATMEEPAPIKAFVASVDMPPPIITNPHLSDSEVTLPQQSPQSETKNNPANVIDLTKTHPIITAVLGAAMNVPDATMTKLMQNHALANAAPTNVSIPPAINTNPPIESIPPPVITKPPVSSKPLSKPIAPSPQAKKKPPSNAQKTYPPLKELAKKRANKFFVSMKAPEMPDNREILIEPLEKYDYSKEGEATITQLPQSLNNAQSFASFKKSFLTESANLFKKILAGTCEQVKSTYEVGVQHPSQINIAITIATSFCNGRFAKVNDLLSTHNEGVRQYNEKMQQQGKLSQVRAEFEKIDSDAFFKQYSELQETAPKWTKILDAVWKVANETDLEDKDINALEAVCQELPIKESSFYTDFSDLTKKLKELLRLMEQKLVVAEKPSEKLSTIRNALVDKLNLELNWLIPQAIFDQALQRTRADICNAILPLFQKPEGVPEDQINFTIVHVDQIYDYLEHEIGHLNSAAIEYIEAHSKFDIVFEPLEADKIRAEAFKEIKPLCETWGMMKKMTSYKETIDLQIVFLEGIAKNLPSSLAIIWGRYPILKLAMREILKKDFMGIKDTENPSSKPIGLFSNYTFLMCRQMDPEKYDKDQERKTKIDAAFNMMAQKLDCEIIAGQSEFYVDQEADAKEAALLASLAKQFTEIYYQMVIHATMQNYEGEECQLYAAERTVKSLREQVKTYQSMVRVKNLMPLQISQYMNVYDV